MWILLIIGGIIGLFIIHNLVQESSRRREIVKKRDITYPQEKVTPFAESKEFLYMSELKTLTDKYGLKPGESESFFAILDNIIKEGILLAKERIKQTLETDENIQIKAQKLLNEVRELRDKDFKMNIEWGDINQKSLKIHPEALNLWAKDYNLSEDLKLRPRETMKKILDEKLFKYGIESVLKKIKVRTEALEKNLNQENWQRVEELIMDIERIINEEL